MKAFEKDGYKYVQVGILNNAIKVDRYKLLDSGRIFSGCVAVKPNATQSEVLEMFEGVVFECSK